VLKLIYHKQFARDLKKAQKRGGEIEKLKKIMVLLASNQGLPVKNRNHKLKGSFNSYYECHIEPNWLLIYKKTSTTIIFVRTGTHADLF